MDFFLIKYIGTFIKWSLSGFRNKFDNELDGVGKHTRYLKKFSIDAENILLGIASVVILIILTLIIISITN